MANTELLNRLQNLHQELSEVNEEIKSTEQIDDATTNALAEIVKDVGNIVDRSRQAESPAEHDDDHSELHDRIIKFEADHPQVSSFLAQISEVLAMMGI